MKLESPWAIEDELKLKWRGEEEDEKKGILIDHWRFVLLTSKVE